MNDHFLQKYRQPPRQAFTRALANRLEIENQRVQETNATPFTLRKVSLGAVAVVAALALVLTASPAARAQVEDWIGQVGGLSFIQTGIYPGGDGPVTIVPEEIVSLEEARARMPFEISLPTWLPEGYVFRDEARLPQFPDMIARVELIWDAGNPRQSALFLHIEDQMLDGTNSGVIAGPDSVEEIQLNSQPAALVRGVWNADTQQWDSQMGLSLLWVRGDQTYRLQTGPNISVAELIRTAESIQ